MNANADIDNKDIIQLERLGFLLVKKECTDDYKRTLFYMVYKTIEKNNSITINQLKWLMKTQLFFMEEDIEAAVAVLSNPTILYGIKKWHESRNDKQAVHLRANHQSPQFKKWLDRTIHEKPELEYFIPPEFKKPDYKKKQ